MDCGSVDPPVFRSIKDHTAEEAEPFLFYANHIVVERSPVHYSPHPAQYQNHRPSSSLWAPPS
ncbi:hypothetical protein GDO81_003187 [Engystomops pustulosus]|uniref:Uncharacterized protein n=1 Tax=Engystomops pustulosus TaxID=76066 RepID=A0AAV7A0C5_ENGPU|nr:hypothetical protein GDO81_003187 [Engystomops pustulosus]